MSAERGNSLVAVALDPARSVVVEACAGSGKTWLLASRIVRLLLAGAAPGEILAITFTRKAAREIEERVVDWLRLLATRDDAEVGQFLAERGIAADCDTLRRARALYERVIAAQPGLAVNTFHGWFLQLVDAAPLSSNLAGATLADAGSRQFDEWWQSFAATLKDEAGAPEAGEEDAGEAGDDAAGERAALAQDFVWLLAEAGLDATRRLVRRGFERRAEWLACAGDADGSGGIDGVLPRVLDELRERLGVGEGAMALDDFFVAGWAGDFHAYLGLLEMSELDTDRGLAQKLAAALADALADAPADASADASADAPADTSADAPARRLAGLCSALLTASGTLRARKPSKALDKRFGADGAVRFLDLHARLGARLLDCLARQCEERAYAFNRRIGAVLRAFLAHVDAYKAARRQIDFVDAEWRVLQLLRDDATAAFVQARLDTRYRHVLLDEFQDTNPLQWQILLAWLGAYSDGSRPCVFLVGDPKQSIYRFRRAEPRLFAAAADFLAREFGAARCEQDATRRNAQPIIDVVNSLFLEEAAFRPFREQESLAGALPGRVELLPLCGAEEGDEQAGEAAAAPRAGLRDPLREADSEPVDSRRRREAERLAERLRAMVGVWRIDDKAGGTRALRYGDVMLLARSRTRLAEYERALSAAGIPFDAASRGGLLGTLEACDIVALLEFLILPAADLQLAHALRSPVFACTDEDLLALAARREAGWWPRLEALAAAGEASPHLARAACLLTGWRIAADRLPAHDLLDRIYAEGEVLARYRLAVPPAAYAGVEANLRALLLLALDQGGGRYPSLPRFIDELRDLRDADAGDAPDEGAIEGDAHTADSGRVRILTIHGAKGLEAPLVWLLDAHAAPRGEEAWDVIVDWLPADAAPQHFSFFGRLAERGRARQPLFDAEAAAAEREELNLLYVAITRARQIFMASGIAGTRDNERTPYRRLEAALARLDAPLAHGDEFAVAAPAAAAAPQAPAAPSPEAPAVPLPRIGERRAAPDAAERFGILLHALLERRTGRAAADGWWRALGFADADYRRVLPVAERLLAAPELRRFFDPAQFRRAWNEVELSGADGGLRRLDRLVEFAESDARDAPDGSGDGALWVLDYKSSTRDTARLDAYRAQVEDYCRTVAAVFPERRVRGALVFADASLLEVC